MFVCMLDIRHKLLKKHEELGLIRNKPDEYFNMLPTRELKMMLKALGENTEDMQDAEHIKTISGQRYF